MVACSSCLHYRRDYRILSLRFSVVLRSFPDIAALKAHFRASSSLHFILSVTSLRNSCAYSRSRCLVRFLGEFEVALIETTIRSPNRFLAHPLLYWNPCHLSKKHLAQSKRWVDGSEPWSSPMELTEVRHTVTVEPHKASTGSLVIRLSTLLERSYTQLLKHPSYLQYKCSQYSPRAA